MDLRVQPVWRLKKLDMRARDFKMTFLGCAFVLFAACGPHTKQEPFDSTRWKGAELYGTDETRLHMLDDVEKRIRGMNRPDVEALLGPHSPICATCRQPLSLYRATRARRL